MHPQPYLYDISPVIGPEAVAWPGDPKPEIRPRSRLEDGDDANVTVIRLSAHTGAHVDAPAHFLADGETIDAFAPGRFLLPAVVVEATGVPRVPAEAIEHASFAPGEGLLLKTDNSARGVCTAGVFREDYVALSPEAARVCVERGAGLIGIDAPSADPFGTADHPAHHVLLGAGIPILETITLRDVPAGRYELICLPLKLPGVEASPVRAVLRAAGADG